jgi:hypothetical protein
VQDFFHGPPLGEFVDQLIQIAQFPHEGFFDVLNAVAADHASDKRPRGIQLRRMVEEILEGGLLLQLAI